MDDRAIRLAEAMHRKGVPFTDISKALIASGYQASPTTVAVRLGFG